ncbi:hypothetical protein ACET3Z_007268 [Daucus carota]
MVNQSMSSRKRALDCSPIKPTLKKRSTSEVPEDRTPKRVSFSVQTLTQPSKRHHDGIEVSIRRESNDSVDERHNGTAVHSLVLEASISITNNTDNREKSSSLSFIKALPSYSRGVKSQTEFNHDSTESAEGVKSQREFNHDRTKSAEGVKSRTQFNHDGYKSTKGRLQSVLPTLCHQNGPVKDIIWRGIVEVIDCGKIRMSEEMIAHLSAKVSRKAFEFSKKIKSKLQFKLFPRSDLYPKIFQDSCPDRDDIALYFYPTKDERSRKKYSQLVKDMELKDLMMRSQVDGRELLVYPSTILTTDSQKLKDSYFMWGVFGREMYEVDFL